MQLLSVFVGKPRNIIYNHREISTGIFKELVAGPVKVNRLNLEGDGQADLKVHGGIDKAVYAYPSEHYAYWKSKRPDLSFTDGAFGENLSVTRMSEKEVSVGDVFRIGSALFTVTTPRMPCFKLGIKMNDPGFVQDFMEARLTGFYFKVLEEGEIEAGNTIVKEGQDNYHLTIDEISSLYTVEKNNMTLLEKAVNAPNLPEDCKMYFQRKLARKK